jgi:threonine aldolase
VTVAEPQTNIVFVELDHPGLDAAAIAAALAARGVLMLDFGSRRLRAITHLDVDDEGIERAVDTFCAVVQDALVAPA